LLGLSKSFAKHQPEQQPQQLQQPESQEQQPKHVQEPRTPEEPSTAPPLTNKIRYNQNRFLGGSLEFVNESHAEWNSAHLVDLVEPFQILYSFELEVQRYLHKTAAYVWIAISDSGFVEGTFQVGTLFKVVILPQSKKRQLFVNNLLFHEDEFVVPVEGAMVQISTWSKASLKLKTSRSA